jgi:hypothetical protein
MSDLTLLTDDATIYPLTAAVDPTNNGAIIHDPAEALGPDEIVTTTSVTSLLEGQGYRVVTVTDASEFPDAEGLVIFGYGYEYQAGPVHYLGRAGTGAILIDPNFIFPETVPVGASVNMLETSETGDGVTGDFWLTDSPAGRVAAEATIDQLVAAGYVVTKTISYPGDVGLGNAGYPTSGAQALSDIVGCFAGSDVDAEVELAREE